MLNSFSALYNRALVTYNAALAALANAPADQNPVLLYNRVFFKLMATPNIVIRSRHTLFYSATTTLSINMRIMKVVN